MLWKKEMVTKLIFCRCPIVKPVLPWGELSVIAGSEPGRSNDGPILWIRPGEQLIPTDEIKALEGRKKGAASRK